MHGRKWNSMKKTVVLSGNSWDCKIQSWLSYMQCGWYWNNVYHSPIICYTLLKNVVYLYAFVYYFVHIFRQILAAHSCQLLSEIDYLSGKEWNCVALMVNGMPMYIKYLGWWVKHLCMHKMYSNMVRKMLVVHSCTLKRTLSYSFSTNSFIYPPTTTRSNSFK